METEIWKSLPGAPAVEVSTFGRVRTLDRVVPRGKHTLFIKGRVLKQNNRKDGYLQVSIPIDGKSDTKRVHRLVAQAFIKNPNDLPEINHKDSDRANNNVSNLEWCTRSYNRQYREKYGISTTESQGHPVFAINLDTLEVSRFQSQGEAGRAIGVSKGNINSVIKGKLKQTGGFWFVNDDDKATEAIKNKLHKIRKGRLNNGDAQGLCNRG